MARQVVATAEACRGKERYQGCVGMAKSRKGEQVQSKANGSGGREDHKKDPTPEEADPNKLPPDSLLHQPEQPPPCHAHAPRYCGEAHTLQGPLVHLILQRTRQRGGSNSDAIPQKDTNDTATNSDTAA